MKRNHHFKDIGECSSVWSGKGKTREEEHQAYDYENEMDESLAGVGYNLRSLEMVMANVEENWILHHASDTLHYDHTNLYGCVQNILTEINNPPNHNTFNPNYNTINPEPDYDLREIPAITAYPQNPETENSTNRFISSPIGSKMPAATTSPVVLVEEIGVHLVNALMACAEAVQLGNTRGFLPLHKWAPWERSRRSSPKP